MYQFGEGGISTAAAIARSLSENVCVFCFSGIYIECEWIFLSAADNLNNKIIITGRCILLYQIHTLGTPRQKAAAITPEPIVGSSEGDTFTRVARSPSMAQNFELSSALSKFLDRHLVFPVLEFHQEKGIYDPIDIMKAKLALLKTTNMVDFAMDIHKALTGTDEVPLEMKEHRSTVVARLRQLQQDVDPIIKCLENPNVVRNFRQDKAFNLQVNRSLVTTPIVLFQTAPFRALHSSFKKTSRSGQIRSRRFSSTPSSSLIAGITRWQPSCCHPTGLCAPMPSATCLRYGGSSLLTS